MARASARATPAAPKAPEPAAVASSDFLAPENRRALASASATRRASACTAPALPKAPPPNAPKRIAFLAPSCRATRFASRSASRFSFRASMRRRPPVFARGSGMWAPGFLRKGIMSSQPASKGDLESFANCPTCRTLLLLYAGDNLSRKSISRSFLSLATFSRCLASRRNRDFSSRTNCLRVSRSSFSSNDFRRFSVSARYCSWEMFLVAMNWPSKRGPWTFMKCMNSSTVTSPEESASIARHKPRSSSWETASTFRLSPGSRIRVTPSNSSKPRRPDSSVSNLLNMANQLPSLTPLPSLENSCTAASLIVLHNRFSVFFPRSGQPLNTKR